MSGSRGEANFVWKCKNCKVRREFRIHHLLFTAKIIQRESSATIQAAPKPYEQSEPAKSRPVLEFDCRGLEFVGFKPEV